MTRNRRRRAALAPLAGLVLVLSGCSVLGGAEPAAESAPVPAAPVVTPDPDVEVLGAPEGQEVEVGDARPAQDPGRGVYFVSSVYDLGGDGLTQPVLVRVRLDNAVPEGTALAVATRGSDTSAWSFLEGRLDPGGRHVEFILDALAPEGASVGVLAVEEGSVRSAALASLEETLAADARRPRGVAPPECDQAAAAREDDYAARGWRRQTVAWCLDKMGDERVLRVTNLRGVPVRVQAPGALDRGQTGDAARSSVPWSTWLAALGPVGGGGGGTTDAFVAPGRTLSLDADLEPGTSLLVTATDDARDRAVQLLHGLAVALGAQVEAAGLGGSDAATVLEAWVGVPPCARALDAVVDGSDAEPLVQACLGSRPMRAAFGDVALLLEPVVAGRELGAGATRAWGSLAQAAPRLEQRIEVLREKPDFGDLVGSFSGSGRSLQVAADGRVTERFGAADGPVVTLTYRLTDARTAGRTSSATATLSAVQVRQPAMLAGAVPRVGQSGTLALTGGVLTPPFLATTYCDAARVARCTEPAAAAPPARPRRP